MTKQVADQTLALSTVPLPISEVRDYIALLKPGVMTLVVFTGAVGPVSYTHLTLPTTPYV